MRRVDREVTDPVIIRHVLETCKKANFGFWDGREPYVVAMNFGFVMNDDKVTLYMHSALEGRKIDLLKAGFDTVAVEMDCEHNLYLDSTIPCKSGMGYKSFMGLGRCRILEGDEKLKGLEILYKHQAGAVPKFPEGATDAINVLCLQLDRYSVKESKK